MMRAEALVDGIALWPVAIPLAAAGLTLLFRRWPTLQRTVMEVAVALMLAASVLLLQRVARGAPIVMKFGGWGAPFGVTFVADGLSAALCTVAGTVALAVAVFARADIRARRRRAGFDALFLAMLAAVNGAFLTGDIFNLYVWFELMLVTALGLITLDRRPAQIDGATRTRRASQSVVPDVDELTRIADLIEPARFKALILNSAWCCLRYDEVTELRPQGYWRRCRSHRWLEEIV